VCRADLQLAASILAVDHTKSNQESFQLAEQEVLHALTAAGEWLLFWGFYFEAFIL